MWKMRVSVVFGLMLLALQQCVAPPVTKNEHDKDENSDHHNSTNEFENTVEYHAYLKEIVQLLESDDDFRKKLEKVDEADIKSGKIAEQLDFVHHDVRTQLDEAKRREVERLRHLATLEYERENNIDPSHAKINEHIDHENPHTFEVKDLKKLIAKTSHDMAVVDEQRRAKFREHEMQMQYEEEEKLKKMSEEEKKKYQEEHEKLKEKQKHHAPLHHPGSKQQLEEVWEKQDHMENQDFDLRAFFHMHDVDGNGVWDEDEVKALFLKELDKLYAQGNPNADIYKRAEEMERMREHVFREMDSNQDRLISYEEFLEESKKPEFEKDPGWKSLDEQEIYTPDDYQRYAMQHRAELEKRIAMGMSPPNHDSYDPGQHQQFAPMYVNAPIDHQQQQQFHGQIPQQQYQGQIPQQQYQGQIPQQQYQGQIPQQQYQGQIPHQQQYQGQIPQYQGQQYVPQHQGQQNIPQYQGHQVPQYQDNTIHGGQVPQYQQGQMAQQQQLQGQIPQQQHLQGQIPQQQQLQGQVPQQQQMQGQIPQQQQAQGQIVQQQQLQGQVPQQQQQLQQEHQKQQQQVNGGANVQSTNNKISPEVGQKVLPAADNAHKDGNSASAVPASPNVVQT